MLASPPVFAEEEYTFDISETEKKPYSFGGMLSSGRFSLGWTKIPPFTSLGSITVMKEALLKN